MTDKAVLITLHGGCFVGGDSSYDKEQTELLKSMNYNVHQIDFKKDNLNVCISDIIDQINKYKQIYINNKFYVLGRSSGGYLAKVLFDLNLFEKAMYIAPVFDPILRGQLVPKLGEKQQPFFQDCSVYKTDKWNNDREMLLLATDDENVPMDCYTTEQSTNAIFLNIKTHSAILKTTSKLFQEIVENFFD